MSTPLLTDNRKQPPSIYTVMLLLSMLFMLIAVIAMMVELSRWAPDYFNTRSARPSVMVISPDSTATSIGGFAADRKHPGGITNSLNHFLVLSI